MAQLAQEGVALTGRHDVVVVAAHRPEIPVQHHSEEEQEAKHGHLPPDS